MNEPSGAEAKPYAQASASSQASTAASSQSNQGDQNNITIPLYEEKISVGKKTVDAGQVRLRKIVKTEQVNQPLELRRETLVIDREPAGSQRAASVSGSASAGSASAKASESSSADGTAFSGPAFQEKEFVIQLKEEQPVVEKQVVHTGNIVARKDAQMSRQTVNREVRKEDIKLDKSGNMANVTIKGNLDAQASRDINEPAGAEPSSKFKDTQSDKDLNKSQDEQQQLPQ
jgi:stress response protein YsnF